MICPNCADKCPEKSTTCGCFCHESVVDRRESRTDELINAPKIKKHFERLVEMTQREGDRTEALAVRNAEIRERVILRNAITGWLRDVQTVADRSAHNPELLATARGAVGSYKNVLRFLAAREKNARRS